MGHTRWVLLVLEVSPTPPRQDSCTDDVPERAGLTRDGFASDNRRTLGGSLSDLSHERSVRTESCRGGSPEGQHGRDKEEMVSRGPEGGWVNTSNSGQKPETDPSVQGQVPTLTTVPLFFLKVKDYPVRGL